MTALAGAVPPAAKPGSPADASPAEVKRLVGQFRGAIKEPEKRAEIVREAIKAGPAAAAGIMAAIQRELGSDVTRYITKFSQKAVPLAQKRSGSAKREEVSNLRETVLGLSKGPNFTHETIVAKADPAMRRLRDIFVVPRREVFEAAPALVAERRKLVDAAKLWDQCAAVRLRSPAGRRPKPPQPPSFGTYLQGEEELAALLAASSTRPSATC